MESLTLTVFDHLK